MSQNGVNKNVIYGLAAAGALVGAAILFNYISNKSTNATSSAVLDEIDALGPAKKEANGLLTFPYYKDIFLLITKHSKAKFGEEKKDMLVRRRAALKDGREAEYKEIVKEAI